MTGKSIFYKIYPQLIVLITTMLATSICKFLSKTLPIRYSYISKKALDEI